MKEIEVRREIARGKAEKEGESYSAKPPRIFEEANALIRETLKTIHKTFWRPFVSVLSRASLQLIP
jgi:hypothetical protein